MFGEWDRDIITHSAQNQEDPRLADGIDGIASEKPAVIEAQFRQFLREFREGNVSDHFVYRDRLNTNYAQGIYSIIVEFEDLNNFSPGLAEKLRNRPISLLPLFERAAQDVVAMHKVPKPTHAEMHSIQVQVTNLSRKMTLIRELDSTLVGKLIKVPGIVVSASKPTCKATKISLQCTNCHAIRVCTSARAFGNILLPRKCENSDNQRNERPCPLDPFTVLADQSEYLDIQKLKIQESPEDIPTGEMPRHLWLFCERGLVNKVKPGSQIEVTGVYKIFQGQQKSKEKTRSGKLDVSVKKAYIEVIGMEELNGGTKKGVFTIDEEEQFRELARNPDIYPMLYQSIAPAIWGNDDIKKAVACLLFGGSRKVLPDGMRLRGDINVLLLGDPSVAKSQFLKFVNNVAPISVYTSGKGSSASGLTASVIKEGGEFHLEGGAMVLADGGVVCIDEFDKMRDSDRVAIHEAMEQQTISIAKAGITTILNSRTSVLAAANPVFGRYDDMRTTGENIEFETTILSRFDLIFIIRDTKDVARDNRLAHHIMDLHLTVGEGGGAAGARATADHDAPISAELLGKYVAYARHRVHPRLTRGAVEMLRNHYVSFRQEAKTREDETGEMSAIPLTVRQLESLIRIAESLAKMELSSEANENHVKEAVRLFKVATLKSAKTGMFDVNGEGGNAEFREAVKKAERNIRRRLAIGSTTSYKKIVDEMVRRNIQQSAVMRALDVMHARGEVEYRNRRMRIFRKR